MSRFWNFVNKAEEESADLYIQGEIVEEGWEREMLAEWFGEKATASSELEQQLKELNGKPLNIHCNSFGGSLFAGTAMYCALINYKGKKTGYIDSMCASAATFPMLACDKTYITSASAYCVHLPMVQMVIGGNRLDIEEQANEVINDLKQIENIMLDAYTKKTGMSKEKIRNILEKDEIMSASKAIELGFVDALVEDEPKFDMAFIENMFKHNVMVYNSLKPKTEPKTDETEKIEEVVNEVEKDEIKAKKQAEKEELERLANERHEKMIKARYEFLSRKR